MSVIPIRLPKDKAEHHALMLAIRSRDLPGAEETRRAVLDQLCESRNHIIRSQAMELRAEIGSATATEGE